MRDKMGHECDTFRKRSERIGAGTVVRAQSVCVLVRVCACVHVQVAHVYYGESGARVPCGSRCIYELHLYVCRSVCVCTQVYGSISNAAARKSALMQQMSLFQIIFFQRRGEFSAPFPASLQQ
jgi:hypothetical protein